MVIEKIDSHQVPKNKTFDWPLIQLSANEKLKLNALLEKYDIQPEEQLFDGLEETQLGVIFKANKSDSYYFAYETDPPTGVIVYSTGKSNKDLSHDFDELLDIFELDRERDIQWVSDFLFQDNGCFLNTVPDLY